MREFELIIDEALRKGLSPFNKAPFNTPVLLECLGWRVEKAGLAKYDLKENPFDVVIDVTPSWPFPQVVTGEMYNFLIVRDSLVNHEDVVYSFSDDHQTVTHIFSVDELTFGQGGLMQVADFGEYAIMMNGVVMIYWNVLGAWNASLATATIPLMNALCNFKGQLVGGGVTTVWHDCDETFYCWSRIGSADFTPEESNEAGYRRCPFGGEIYHTRRLRNNVIGYSSKGITILSPVGSPSTTFGFTELSDVGLKNQGAMDGNLDMQVYVGEDDVLRKITQNGIEELGYEDYMSELGANVIVQFDKKYKDFYIGDGAKTFLLSPQGLSEIPQHPSAVWRRNNETYMLPDETDDYYQTVASYPTDMGYAGQKTIMEVETDLFMGHDNEAAVSYYLNPSSYSTTNYVPLNNQNIATIIASGNAFSIHLRCDPLYDNSRMGYIKARYKMTDLRGIRGVYAPKPRGQA